METMRLGTEARNAIVSGTRRLGRTLWKKWIGYHRLSLVETKMRCSWYALPSSITSRARARLGQSLCHRVLGSYARSYLYDTALSRMLVVDAPAPDSDESFQGSTLSINICILNYCFLIKNGDPVRFLSAAFMILLSGHAFAHEVSSSSASTASNPIASHFTGRGTERAQDGIYEGDFVNGKRHGKGVFTRNDGTRYEGGFTDNLMSGYGKISYSNGARFEGEALNGNLKQGVLRFADGVRYEGQFVNNLRDGQGTQIEPDGSRYEGTFRTGRFDGVGILTYGQGTKYQGMFAAGKLHGLGTLTWSGGSKFEGKFQHGARTGWGTLVTADGRQFTGEYLNGNLVSPATNANAQAATANGSSDNSFLIGLIGAAVSGFAEGRARADSTPMPSLTPPVAPREKSQFNCTNAGFGNVNCKER